MIKDKRTAFALYVVLFMVFWNIADILWASFVNGAGHDFAIGFDIVTPLIAAIVTGYLFFIAKQVDINDELEEARKTPGAVILDVREPDEYAQGHVPGAINVPADSMETISDTVADKNTPVFTYCLTGSRSNRAAKDLRAMGYTQVINMGGINKYKGRQEN